MNKKHKRSHMKDHFGNEKEGVLESDKELQLTPEEIERIKLVPFLEWLRGKRGRTVRWLILYGILLAILVTQVRLVYVTSESIPYTCCLQLYNVKPQVGDLCVFDFHKTSNEKTTTLVKYVAGKSGDKIRLDGRKVYVNDRYIGNASSSNLTPAEEKIIPEGFVFVAGTHRDSLDSRYKEFGLIKESDLKGKAIGLKATGLKATGGMMRGE